MKRKVIKQGTSTLTVSLPSKWIKEHGIKPGDEVDMEEVGPELRVGAGSAKHEKKAELNIEGMKDRLIFRHMNVLYTNGYDEIRFFFNDPSQLETVQYMLNRLIGFTIVEQKRNSCVVKEVVDTRGEDFDKILKRVFLTIDDIAIDSLNLMRGKDWAALEKIKQRDRDVVNKLAFFCLRILSKKGYSQPEKTQAMWDLVLVLESMGDEYANLSEELAILGKPLSKSTLDRIAEVNTLMMDVEKLFYSYDRGGLARMHEKARTLRFDVSKAAKAMSREDFIALFHVRKIAELLLTILESIIVLNVTSTDEGIPMG
jgi:phosphate uptake regulator